ncbi:MAG TPA: TetR family transcriptional regulator [Pseudonocardia sp.]|nr:TetR family transcriptional regulator [Pseudonocardia sp.]
MRAARAGEARPGLRERKKQLTRQAILDTAKAMFAERGYDGVTVAEIADAVNIAAKTVFVYFPSKEDLVFDGEAEMRERIVARIRDRAPGETPLRAMGGLMAELMAESGAEVVTELATWRRMMGDSAVLQSRMRLLWERFEDALAAALAEEAGRERYNPVSRVAAAQLILIFRLGVSEEILDYAQAHPSEGQRAAVQDWVDVSLALVGGGLGEYARRSMS